MRLTVLASLVVFLVGCNGAGRSKDSSANTGTSEPQNAKIVGGNAADSPALRWDEQNTQKPLTISREGLTLSWDSAEKLAWLRSQTTGRLALRAHGGAPHSVRMPCFSR